ncbi:kinase-like domain-containing protein [Lactarius quietus]|nr:kinase-like domain-containing protein [Lactarius quietus]
MSKATVEEQDTLHAVLAEQHVMRHASGHPYILGLLASFHDSDNFYLVSEYCVSSLFEAQLFEADKKLASAELACAIDHLHGLGIIHRDIKLENVMIKTDGHIVLGDFGLACSLEASPESHLNDSLSTDGGDFFVPVSTDICGTLPYMAPEVLCGMEYSYNVDWFSYGVFLHVFHLNEFPWLGSHENPTSYLKALMSAISLGTIFQNKLFGDLLKKLLSPNQDARGGFSIVKRATFFADIDWEDVMNVASSAPYPLSKPASEVCDALGDKHPPFTGDVAQSTMDPDQFPNFTWVNPSMIVGESIPDGSGGHPEGCTTDVLSDSVNSLDEGEDPIYIFPPCWIAAFEDSAIYLRERKAERTQTTPQDDEALVRTTIRSLDAGEEPVFELPSGWKDAFSPSPSPEVTPLSSPRPDVAEKSSVLPRLKSLWKRAASKFAPRHV